MAILSEMSMSGMPLPEHVVTRVLDPQVYRDVQLAVPSLKEASLAAKLFIEVAQGCYLRENKNANKGAHFLSSFANRYIS